MLTALSRPHNANEARNAILLVEEVGFENINIDLMFGVPSGTYNSDMLDLNEAISFQPGHISRYQLTIEEGTKISCFASEGSRTKTLFIDLIRMDLSS